ncbi:MAG: PKD domain-containing protein [Deltaproteobacteria bacterium]|nr:PKD domain-containing protein [Deltaproteobacteria bacterium]
MSRPALPSLVLALVFGVAAHAAAQPVPDLVASRTEGAAPLAVFFDAGATTCTGCGDTRPFHDLAYAWRFGDGDAEVWESGRSRGSDQGPTSAHVFERPGTYTVTLTVTDPESGAERTSTETIVVSDPFAGTATRCFRASATSSFDGCPAGAMQETSADFDAALASCMGEARRCLFRRGDTFRVDRTTALRTAGPLHVGAFGPASLERPLLDASSLGAAGVFDGQSGGSDYRVTDLRVQGPAVFQSLFYGAHAAQRHVLLLRVALVEATFHSFVIADRSTLGPTAMHRNFFVVDCDAARLGFTGVLHGSTRGPGGNGSLAVFAAWRESAILGNRLLDLRNGEHVIRAQVFDDLLIAHNLVGGAHHTKSLMTLRSTSTASTECPLGGDGCAPSRRAHVRANTLIVNTAVPVQICGQSGGEPVRCEDTLVEGNYAYLDPLRFPAEDLGAIFHIGDNVSVRATARANVCDLTGAFNTPPRDYQMFCVEMQTDSESRAIGNTCYRGDDTVLRCIHATRGGARGAALDNLAYHPSGPTVMVTGAVARDEGNLVTTSNPFVVRTPGHEPRDFALADGSPAIDVGVAAPMRFDFLGRARPAGAGMDAGAFEHGTEEPVPTTCGNAACDAGETRASCFADCGTVDAITLVDATSSDERTIAADWTSGTIDYTSLPSRALGLEARCEAPCASVAFVLDGSFVDARTRAENTRPFSMGGDAMDWIFGIGCSMGSTCEAPLAPGAHTIEIVPCSGRTIAGPWTDAAALAAACEGTVGPRRTIAIEIVEGPEPGADAAITDLSDAGVPSGSDAGIVRASDGGVITTHDDAGGAPSMPMPGASGGCSASSHARGSSVALAALGLALWLGSRRRDRSRA